ncbi:hypothetical protein LCGC14_2825880, partial [marine sediment metagenome]
VYCFSTNFRLGNHTMGYNVVVTLAGATGVAKVMVQSADFEPVTFGQTEYIAATFKLEVLVLEPFEWAIGAVA